MVVVLSPEYVRKQYSMRELDILLARHRADPGSVRMLPVLQGINFRQCNNLEEDYYTKDWVGVEQMPTPDVLAHWASSVRELLKTSAVSDDQVGSLTLQSKPVLVQM